jgi:hypothetical protein
MRRANRRPIGRLLAAGRPLIPRVPDAQSRLDYHRPLQDGDRIRYEFFYEPQLTTFIRRSAGWHCPDRRGAATVLMSRPGEMPAS